jgi:septal ring factor EnvC (AmiA/AmiB activator)
MADRKDLPKRFIEDQSKTAILIAAAETLDTFISGLSIVAIDEAVGSLPDIQDRKGKLVFPVNGRILREFKSADAAGIVRPGIIVATKPGALVSTPTAATLRYRGELLDYGLVSILEPQKDILFIFSGLAQIFGNIGEVLPEGSPIGIMSGELPSAGKMLKESVARGGTYRPKTLYIEVRENETPQDPLRWFQVKKD